MKPTGSKLFAHPLLEGSGIHEVLAQFGKSLDAAAGIYPGPSSSTRKKTDLSSYGVILRADLKDRTALVKWIRVNKRAKG